MCGRFTLYASGQLLSQTFDAPLPSDFAPRYNIAPAQSITAVRTAAGGNREITLLKWGLIPPWSKDPAIGARMINARSETALEKPSFRTAFKRHRCLIPANGFYEWQKKERSKQPHYVRMRDGRLFAFAGLWDRWEGVEGDAIESCTILTTGANSVLAPIHDRMPVILRAADYRLWLHPEVWDSWLLMPLLAPFPPEDMVAFPVSPRVNAPTVDDERCMEPLP